MKKWISDVATTRDIDQRLALLEKEGYTIHSIHAMGHGLITIAWIDQLGQPKDMQPKEPQNISKTGNPKRKF